MDDGLPLPQPQRGWAMLAILSGVLLSSLDAAVANVALPTFTQVFGVNPAETVWVVNAYQLAMAVCILPAAALGDSLGYKRVYCTGLLLLRLATSTRGDQPPDRVGERAPGFRSRGTDLFGPCFSNTHAWRRV